jgi:pseudouridine kinase
LTPREKEIIDLIKSNPMISQQEIAEKLNITRSGVSTHINNLSNQGFIIGRGYILREDEYVAILGGCNMDIVGSSFNKLKDKDSNPGRITYSSGGVARNICENLSRLEVNTTFLSVLGEDDAGVKIFEELNALNVDTSKILFENGDTPHYLAVLDDEKDMRVAISDMELLKKIDKDYILKNKTILENAKYVVVDTNLEKETLEVIYKNVDAKLLIDGVSTVKALKLKDILDGIYFLKLNIYEAKALADVESDNLEEIGKNLISKGLHSLVITAGEKGSYYFDKDNFIIKESRPIEVVNASGAGDAFMAGYVYGLFNEYDIKDRLSVADAMARIALKSESTSSEEINLKNLEDELNEF